MTTHEGSPGEKDVPTTGDTSDDELVGRVSGDESGDTDESGGDRRAGRPEDAHDGDPVLSGLSEAERKTLIAVREEDGYRFDVRLQGPDETVFFDV